MTYELYHHGIKGMKWGVRRYQNTDGSYTAAGKSRRSSSGSGKSGMSSKTKSRLKTAAKVAGAAALAGGAAYAISRRSGSGTTALATVPHNTISTSDQRRLPRWLAMSRQRLYPRPSTSRLRDT